MHDGNVELYAEFAVRSAVNVQKGQTFFINSPIEAAPFARLCAQKGYEAGAREVLVFYTDEQLSRIGMQQMTAEALEDVKPWMLNRYMEYARQDGDVCRLAIYAEDPEIYKGLDGAKISRATQARQRLMKPFRELQMANRLQWSVVSVPTGAWAARVLPGLPADEAQARLWQAIFRVARVEGGDPVAAWREHARCTRARINRLNGMNLAALQLKNAAGTNLTVGLADGHLFEGVEEKTLPGGVPFLPNVPSEEVFTAPHCRRVDGVVKSSLPFVYNGNLIEDITVEFKDGIAVKTSAGKNADILEQMLSSDEGARRLGEIALVPASSPVRQTGLLFYNTLFDENAACHMAFGAAYPNNVQGGGAMGREELDARGVNDSLIHEDVMIGTPDMEIWGVTKNGAREQIFENGEWVF